MELRSRPHGPRAARQDLPDGGRDEQKQKPERLGEDQRERQNALSEPDAQRRGDQSTGAAGRDDIAFAEGALVALRRTGIGLGNPRRDAAGTACGKDAAFLDQGHLLLAVAREIAGDHVDQ
jgi:hypothetical protein